MIFNRKIKRFSFRESMALSGLPIISFENNHHWVNMLLDTGGTDSIIDSNYIQYLEYTDTDKPTSSFVGTTGKTDIGQKIINISLTKDDDKSFNVDCTVINLGEAFTAIKESYGVQLHGILGTDFLDKYKYVIDFEKMIAYNKAE